MSWAPPGIPSDVIDFHLHRARELQRVTGDWPAKGDQFVAQVQREYGQREHQAFQDIVAGMPIAELRRHGPSGIRTKALEDDGLHSVADVVGWTAERFAAVPGIGPKTAPALEAATRAAADSVRGQFKISLDDDPDNRLLLTALYRLLLWEQISRELAPDQVRAELVPAQARSARILRSRIRWGLARPARRSAAVSALHSLASALSSGVAERAASAMNQVCEEPELARVLADVNEQPQRYHDTLRRLIPHAAVRPAAPRVPDSTAKATRMDLGREKAPSPVLEPSPNRTMGDELTPVTGALADAAEIRSLAATAETDAARHSGQVDGGRHIGESVGTAPFPRGASQSAGTAVLPDPGIWSTREVVEPADAASTTSVAEVLAEIVRVEGPMHAELAYRRYVHASGGQRVGPALRRALDSALSRLVAAGRVRVIAEQAEPTITLYGTGTEPVCVRALGERRLQDVPKSEVHALMEQLGLDHGVDAAQIKRATLTAYGRTAMTRAAEDYLDSCISYRRGLAAGD